MDFPNDSDLKLFVVLRHFASGNRPSCLVIKITSNTSFYESSPDRLASCVLYQAGEVAFLPKKSVIEPHNEFNIGHEHFERSAKNNEFKVEGKMPDDFHARLVAATRDSCLMNQKEKTRLLEAIGEPPSAKPATSGTST